jgi:dihydroorotase-like cyclic amidohydrolase
LKSKSKNNPFIGKPLKGKVKAVFNASQHQLF